MNYFDNEDKKDIEDIEIVIGDDSNLEFSDVEDFATDLKPTQEKKTNIVIPTAKKKTDKEKDENKK